MYMCARCIEAARSHGEKLMVGESVALEYEVYADEPQVCGWCDEEADELFEVTFM